VFGSHNGSSRRELVSAEEPGAHGVRKRKIDKKQSSELMPRRSREQSLAVDVADDEIALVRFLEGKRTALRR
jgi:hypothetical protein